MTEVESLAQLPVEDIPLEIRKHISVCDCQCNHLGYGNYQTLREQESFSIPPLPEHCLPQLPVSSSERGPTGSPPADPEDSLRGVICDLVSDHILPGDRPPCQARLFPRPLQLLENTTSNSEGPNTGNSEWTLNAAKDRYYDNSCHVNHLEDLQLTIQKSSRFSDFQENRQTLNKPEKLAPGSLRRVGPWSWALCTVLAVILAASVGVGVPLALRVEPSADEEQRLYTARQMLQQSPLVDGHNDLPWNLRKFVHNNLRIFNFSSDLRLVKPWSRSPWSHTDIPRLRRGRVSAQFWAAYVPCESQFKNAVQMSLEQVDLIRRLVLQYPDHMTLALSAKDIVEGHAQGKLVSLIGLEGGHSIQSTLATLRTMYMLGVRYMTLTHTCHTPWAESSSEQSTDKPPRPKGLTKFGLTVVREMNRLGMMIDLSHVSARTAEAALLHSEAPVFFSHSSARALCDSRRNVSDRLLRLLAKNGGIVMVSFYNYFLTCNNTAMIADVIAHINHIRRVAGIDHVGIGAGYDGINVVPTGLEDVSKYPNLFAELLKDTSWTINDLHKLSGKNMLRVFQEVEQVRDRMRWQGVEPLEELIPGRDLAGTLHCTYRLYRQNKQRQTHTTNSTPVS